MLGLIDAALKIVDKLMTTIVMTGASAGIGRVAARVLTTEPNVRLVAGGRTKPASVTEFLPLDLTSLASVRDFAVAVRQALGETRIDALVLNAGMQFGNTKHRTVDGYETTFAANHLAHYLLLRLLMPRLSMGAVVVITTSNLHDPNTNPVAPPEHADAKLLSAGKVEAAEPPSLRSGVRAYASSKLCNMLTAESLASSASAHEHQLRVIAFNPGFTPGTKLTRHHSLLFRLPFSVVTRVISAFRRVNTVVSGGDMLAGLVNGRIAAPQGRIYASQIRRELQWPTPSAMAVDDAVMTKLWRDSAELVGVPENL